MKFTENRYTEILAPAGNMECISAAAICGADAIYIGGERFSARASATNFSDEEIKQVIEYCHLRGIKVYQALNTVVFDHEIDDFISEAISSAKVGIDALIIQDIGMARLLKRTIPDIPLHASTQMTVHTPEGAKYLKENGFSRVVVSRELSLEKIKEICNIGVEVEAFIHGALCMSVSGQCYMSALIGSRSANRGMCAQSCRLPFNATDNNVERHDLSLKDMCHISQLEELKNAGVTSFKIEGRMKRAEYVAAATKACKDSLEGRKPDIDTLKAVFSRSGFTDGYLKEKTGAEMFGYRSKDDVLAAASVIPEIQNLYKNDRKYYTTDIHTQIKKNNPSTLTIECGNIKATVKGDIPEKALKRAVDAEYAEKQLSKLGGTVFEMKTFSSDIDEGLSLSAASLNALRRNAISELEKEIALSNTPTYNIKEDNYEDFGNVYIEPEKKYNRLHIRHHYQLDTALEYGDYVIMPHYEADGNEENKDKIILSPDRFITDEKKMTEELEKLKQQGYKKLYCNNIAHISIGQKLGYELHGGFGLNITNSYSVSALANAGLKSYTASFEMRLHDVSALCDIIPCSLIIYGNLPAMLTRNCPIRQAVGCKQCKKQLNDRTGRVFEVSCNKNKTYTEIFNSDKLYLCDRINEINGVTFYDYLMNNLSPEEIRKEMKKNLCHEKPTDKFTRGLYYRGIL